MFARPREDVAGAGTLRASRGDAVTYRVAGSRVPVERSFVIDFAQDVLIDLDPQSESPDLKIELWRGTEMIAEGDDPELIHERLEPGSYVVKVLFYDESESSLGQVRRDLKIGLNLKAER
jgi:hypothetical protein